MCDVACAMVAGRRTWPEEARWHLFYNSEGEASFTAEHGAIEEMGTLRDAYQV